MHKNNKIFLPPLPPFENARNRATVQNSLQATLPSSYSHWNKEETHANSFE